MELVAAPGLDFFLLFLQKTLTQSGSGLVQTLEDMSHGSRVASGSTAALREDFTETQLTRVSSPRRTLGVSTRDLVSVLMT